MPEPETPQRHWKTLGFELEGAWDITKSELEALAPCTVHGDVSVTARIDGGYAGEVVAQKPYQRLSAALETMTKLWPQAVNESCGFHLHVGFSPGDYSVLVDQRFYDHFLEKWRVWGEATLPRRSEPEFWNRLEGRNRYCAKVFQPDQQMTRRGKDGPRFAHLNYCWSRYKTVECRLLPMFRDPAVGVLAVKNLLWIYDSWLDAAPDTSLAHELPEERDDGGVRIVEDSDLNLYAALDDVHEVDELAEVGTTAVLQYRDTLKTDAAVAARVKRKYPTI